MFLPADKVTQVCSISPLSLTFVGGHGGDKKGDRTGRGADCATAPHWTEPRAKPRRKLEPPFTKL